MVVAILFEFFYSRVVELLFSVLGFAGCVLFYLFAADILYYILVILGVLSYDPENSPFRPVPFARRVETVSCALAGSPVFITFLFLSFCIFNFDRTWWWLVPYATYAYFDKTPMRGGQCSSWFRNSAAYRNTAKYFPAKLIKWHETTEFPTDRSYLFGYHPHGILGCGAVTTFGSEGAHFSDIFPGLDIKVCTLNIIVFSPVVREWAMAQGFISVGRESLDYVLEQGNGKGAVVVVGGAHEAVQTQVNGHDLVLKKRRGFFRVALNHGCLLVPVYGFGENNLYHVAESSGWKASLSNFTQQYLGFSMPIFTGRGIFQKRFGVIPARHPLNVVIGDPIDCPKIENPTEEQIDDIQKKYCGALMKMFDEMKLNYVKDPENEQLRFVL